ncbi:hypothetical protein roselon_03278 [Roseibacterium elongatum DSM 19469]|uniref:Uncharacterized protein n=1 Tax=Roseicyclus elongatus DSM 19469 TaxID=1294273 RepID=W8RW55_9RHOB|nr:hypothetical protein roselon_03278 [Roseibacterium elongatum DSM 19469]
MTGKPVWRGRILPKPPARVETGKEVCNRMRIGPGPLPSLLIAL